MNEQHCQIAGNPALLRIISNPKLKLLSHIVICEEILGNDQKFSKNV